MNKLSISAFVHTAASITLELAIAVTAAVVNYKLGLLVLLLVLSRRGAEAIHNLEVQKLEEQYKKEMMGLLTQTFSKTAAPVVENEQYERNSTLQ